MEAVNLYLHTGVVQKGLWLLLSPFLSAGRSVYGWRRNRVSGFALALLPAPSQRGG